MSKFVDHAELKDAVGFKKAFETALAGKIEDAISAKRIDIAQNMFTGEVDMVVHEETEQTYGCGHRT